MNFYKKLYQFCSFNKIQNLSSRYFNHFNYLVNVNLNKKVLMRERKRHTARHVASTPYVVLTGYPPCPDLAGGVPTWVPPQQGTPPGWTWQGIPPLDLAGYPPPPGRVPHPRLDLAGYPLPQLVLAGYPPTGVCPMAFWEMLQSIMGYGYPPPV